MHSLLCQKQLLKRFSFLKVFKLFILVSLLYIVIILKCPEITLNKNIVWFSYSDLFIYKRDSVLFSYVTVILLRGYKMSSGLTCSGLPGDVREIDLVKEL